MNDSVRSSFHSLPIDKQREWTMIAEDFIATGRVVIMLFCDDGPEGLEISVRIDEKFNPT